MFSEIVLAHNETSYLRVSLLHAITPSTDLVTTIQTSHQPTLQPALAPV